MSDSLNHDRLSDDLFRNRIAAALSELDQPESAADIAAALDSIDAEPLTEAATRRIMQQVQQWNLLACESIDSQASGVASAPRLSVAIDATGGLTPPRSPILSSTLRVERLGSESRATGRRLSQLVIVVACAALVAVGLVFQRFDDAERPPLRTGELISWNDRQPGSRSSHTEQSTNSAAIQRVTLGETLSTGPREKRRVTLLDGSVLSINERSRVIISGNRRVKLLAGEVFVEVMPAKNSERFVVETPQRTVTALGTKFVVKAQGPATSVVVTQGKVQVSGVDEVIPAGQELIADLNESTSAELRPAKRSAYVVEWVKDLMASAGSIVVPVSEHAGGTVTVVDPQGQEMKLSLRKFHVDVHIEEGFARTTIDQTYFNHTWQQLEGTFRFPLPADASLSRLAMYVNGKLMEGGMVERDYGRNVFEQIRHTKRDPALLEWVDGSTFQMRVFPLEARQEKRILLSYTQRLPNDYGKSVYRFPAGHSLEGVREWSTSLRVKGAAGTKWYSPSHLLNGRDEHGDLLLDGREEHAALDRDLVVELGEPQGASRGSAFAQDRRRAPNGTDFTFFMEAERRKPSGFVEFCDTSPDGLRRSASKVSAIGLAPARSRMSVPEDAATWSLCEQDGFQYVMLRQRPELKANVERSRRQWIFLVENSADRNDILAETQRQIAKVLLENAEHTDTFSIIRAGTQAESFRRKPAECTLENVAAAQQFLSAVAPIGALDLEQALQAVAKQVRGKRDVWIVHLGTGIPVLGERDDTTLLRLLPAHARYVGVAVGKRWSKSFMESAANHSGGHVTQINPDEAVVWRAFDLLSTLNAPRLTEISVRSSDVASAREGEAPAEPRTPKTPGSAGASPSQTSRSQTSPSQFLLLTNSLAHGQELAAVARFPKGQALPKSVTITGKLNGKAYSQTVSLASGAASAPRSAATQSTTATETTGGLTPPRSPSLSHLPRTWARLEIDRLVALGATEHKPQIIELSKSMYVMSPFTSLLVLETEAMYEQFKVDRGRKDHWAMYPAPAEIPVVADQSPSQLSPLDAAKERLKLSQARAKSAQSNYERSVTEKRPATDLQRLERLNRAEQAEVRLIESEIQRIEKANAAAADPIRIAWESVVQRRSAWQQVYLQQAAQHHWNLWARPNRWDDFGVLRGEPSLNLFGRLLTDESLDGLPAISGNGVRDVNQFLMERSSHELYVNGDGSDFTTLLRFGDRASMQLGDVRGNRPQVTFSVNGSVMGLSPIPVTPYFATSMDGELREEYGYIRLPIPNSADDDWVRTRPDRPVVVLSDSLDVGFDKLSQRRFRFQRPQVHTVPIGADFGTAARQGASWMTLPRFGDARTMFGGIADFDGDMDGDGIADSIWFDREPGLVNTNGPPDEVRLRIVDGRQLLTRLFDNSGFIEPIAIGGDLAFEGWHGAYKGRQRHYATVNMSHPLTGVLQDLPSYAPGLQTWPADRLAIVEQAAATKPKRGEVDAESRRLIEKARSLGWESCKMAAPGRPAVLKSQTRTAGGGHPTVIADGSGRFVFDREVGEGLREQVIHDGSTLWHLYPEIGLGAKRTLSRFHQSAIQSLIPWYVPSADDLSVEADVKSVGERTIRITRLKDDAPVAELVFAEDGRLSESRVIGMRRLGLRPDHHGDDRSDAIVKSERVGTESQPTVLAKQTFDADGTIRLFDADDKLIAEVKYERQPIEAPNLVPAAKDLVVLPLPYRSAAGVPVTVPVNLQTNAPDYAKLSEEDALLLLASYFAEARPAELATFIEQRYTAKGDHRIGLAVLLSSVMPQNPLVAKATKQHPDEPLAYFLEQFSAVAVQGNHHAWLEPASASPFLNRLVSAYNHHSRWAADQAAPRDRAEADIQKELATTLLFVRECRSLELATRLLSTVHLGLKRTERMNATFARLLNDTTVAIAEARDLPAFARTARIEWLLTAGDDASIAQAKELFRAQLTEAIANGSLPALNGDTRSAFVKHLKTPAGQPCGPWGELVLEAARLDQPERASVRFGNNTNDKPDASAFRLIGLARACVSLSEPTLAAAIFQLAIKDQDLVAQPRLNLAALTYAKEASHWEQAEACVQRALADEKLQKVSQLWRDAAAIKHQLRKFSEWIECLDRAYELEFAALPKTVNLETFRKDYDSLFGQLDQRTEQLADAQQSDKLAFARLVQRAAARWRDIDVDDTAACHRTAAILTKLGLATAAWNYWTTPLAETPDRSTVWQAFATAMHSQQRFIVADRAWSTAFACEPTNPEILLQHAQFLRSTRQEHKAHELLTKITSSTWQPRFENTKQQAQQLLATGGSSK